jgi:serine/threonine-protein kinase HipA
MTLAAKARIRVAQTRPIRLTHGHALAIRRFDRDQGQRRHALTANVALKAAGELIGYPELAQLLRRRGNVERDQNVTEMRELFRRMVFNILLDNTDDHEKNHVLLVNDAVHYELSPAFDVLPSGQALGFQRMRVGEAAADSTLENALSLCAQFGLTRPAARREIALVASVVAGWREHFLRVGVTRTDVEQIEEQIERPFLREQRAEFDSG